MLTSLAFVALTSGLAPVPANGVEWLSYADGAKRCAKEHKPMLVVIGSGKTGWTQLTPSRGFSKDVLELLRDKYVCVYVDAEKQQQLAEAFEMDGLGMVISNGDGDVQAFRHAGTLTNYDLEGYLDRFADPSQPVAHTEDPVEQRQSFYRGAPTLQQLQQPYYYPNVCRT